MPRFGAAAMSPACARGMPCTVCSSGMRKAGVASTTVVEVCAETDTASMAHGRGPATRRGDSMGSA